MLRFSISKYTGGAAQGGPSATPAAPDRAPAPDRAAVPFLEYIHNGCALLLPGSLCLFPWAAENACGWPPHAPGGPPTHRSGVPSASAPPCRMPVLATRSACLVSSCALLLMYAGERLAAGLNARALSA